LRQGGCTNSSPPAATIRTREDAKKPGTAGYFATRPKNRALRKHIVFQYLRVWSMAKPFATEFARNGREGLLRRYAGMCRRVWNDALADNKGSPCRFAQRMNRGRT
jgi:hypothetical protein